MPSLLNLSIHLSYLSYLRSPLCSSRSPSFCTLTASRLRRSLPFLFALSTIASFLLQLPSFCTLTASRLWRSLPGLHNRPPLSLDRSYFAARSPSFCPTIALFERLFYIKPLLTSSDRSLADYISLLPTLITHFTYL